MSQYTPGNFGGRPSGMSGGEMSGATSDVVMPPPLPSAPPIVQGMMAKPLRAPVWPTPIGIIAIVFGAGGALLSVYTALMPWLFSSMEHWAVFTPNSTAAMSPFASIRHWAVALTVVHGIGVLIATGLLAGGIGLLQRRVWGARVLFWWAIVRIPMAFVVTAVTALQQQEQMAAMSGQAGGAFVGAFASGFVWFASILSIAWYCAFPTFMIIWLTRPGVRADVKMWSAGEKNEARG